MQKNDIKFEKFKNALLSLEAIYLKPVDTERMSIDATIQRFEFTCELAWKFLKVYLAQRDIFVNYPKEVLKEAFALRLIEDEGVWIQMLRDRNMTPHTYDEKLADEIYGRIKTYVPALRQLLCLEHEVYLEK